MPDVRVFVAEGCHLCGPAVEVVRTVCGDGVHSRLDITGDEMLERRYRERIPVVEIDGVERFRYEVAEEDLRALL